MKDAGRYINANSVSDFIISVSLDIFFVKCSINLFSVADSSAIPVIKLLLFRKLARHLKSRIVLIWIHVSEVIILMGPFPFILQALLIHLF
jgi:hypothetical protein